MKILLKIAIPFILFFSMLSGMLFSYTNSDNVRQLEENETAINALGALANMMGAGSEIGGIPTAADYQRAVYVDVIFFLTCIVGIVFTFLKAKKGGLVVAALVAVLALTFYFMQPMLKGAAYADDNADKSFALGVAIWTLIGAGLLALLKFKFSSTAGVSDASENANTEDSLRATEFPS